VASSLARGLYEPLDDRRRRNPDQKTFEWRESRLHGAHDDSVPREQWEQMSRFQKNCWRWMRINRIIEGHVERLDLPVRYLRLESLHNKLSQIALWLNIAEPLCGFRLRRDNASKGERRSWRDWTTGERKDFEKWCGGAMDDYYPGWRTGKGEWREISIKQDRGLSFTQRFKRRCLQTIKYPLAGYKRLRSFGAHFTE